MNSKVETYLADYYYAKLTDKEILEKTSLTFSVRFEICYYIYLFGLSYGNKINKDNIKQTQAYDLAMRYSIVSEVHKQEFGKDKFEEVIKNLCAGKYEQWFVNALSKLPSYHLVMFEKKNYYHLTSVKEFDIKLLLGSTKDMEFEVADTEWCGDYASQLVNNLMSYLKSPVGDFEQDLTDAKNFIRIARKISKHWDRPTYTEVNEMFTKRINEIEPQINKIYYEIITNGKS